MPGIFGSMNFGFAAKTMNGKLLCHNDTDKLQQIKYEDALLGCACLEGVSNGVYEGKNYIFALYGEIFDADGMDLPEVPLQSPRQLAEVLEIRGGVI